MLDDKSSWKIVIVKPYRSIGINRGFTMFKKVLTSVVGKLMIERIWVILHQFNSAFNTIRRSYKYFESNEKLNNCRICMIFFLIVYIQLCSTADNALIKIVNC